MCEPIKHRARTLIGDAWFGSVKCAVALKSILGVYSVLNVKGNSKLMPLRELREACSERGDQITMHAVVNDVDVWASCHMDKQPMNLVHTAGHSGEGPSRQRNWCKYLAGSMQRRQYVLQQPHVHSLYRGNFSTVDVYNKYTFGPRSLQMPFKTRDWRLRFFFALLAMCETNAYLAYRHICERDGYPIMDHMVFRMRLSERLIESCDT